jgi:hypothetical protein
MLYIMNYDFFFFNLFLKTLKFEKNATKLSGSKQIEKSKNIRHLHKKI